MLHSRGLAASLQSSLVSFLGVVTESLLHLYVYVEVKN